MKKITKKQKLIASLVVGVAFLFFGGRSLVAQLYSRLVDLRQKIKVAEKQLEKGLGVQKDKDKILSDYKMYESYFKPPAKTDKKIFAELLKEIERLMHSVNGSIVSLIPQDEPVEEKTHKEYKASLRVEMRFGEFLQLLSDIQESSRLLKFEKLIVASQGANVLRVEGTIGWAVPK